MDAKTKRWLDQAQSVIKIGEVALLCEQASPMTVSLVFDGNANKELLDITIQCIESGSAKENHIHLNDQGIITWKAINPEIFEGFRQVYGDIMAFSSLRAIHENPESVHAYNAAYLLGRKGVVDRGLASEIDKSDKSTDMSP